MAIKEAVSGEFLQRLRAVNRDGRGRQWAFIPYDQLHDNLGLLGSLPPHEVGIVLVETTWKPQQRRYHKQKLALLLASQRHFALEQAARGVAVRYVMGEEDYGTMLRSVAGELGPLDVMMPAERELRRVLEPLVAEGALRIREHEGWMTTESDFAAAMRGKRQWRMDTFYRHIRKQYGWLKSGDGKPLGGKWSHDADNRQPWRGDPPAPEPLRFDVDPVTAEEYRDQLKATAAGWEISDFRYHLVAEGDFVVSIGTWKIDGALQMDWVQAFRIEAGKIVETWLPAIGSETAWPLETIPGTG